MSDVDKTTEKQLGGATGKGFMPGQSGNPAGRPKGSISPITRVKQIFQEKPEFFEEFITEYITDPANRKHVVEMLDGKPMQKTDITSDGEALQPLLVKFIDGNNSTHTE